MRAELGVRVGRVGVGVSGACEDGAALDAGLKALLAEGETFELGEAVLFCGAACFSIISDELGLYGNKSSNSLHSRILQYYHPRCLMEDGRLALPTIIVDASCILQFTAIATLVLQKPRVVVALVEVLEDAGEDFGLLVGQVNPFVVGFEELAATVGCEERGDAEDVFVGGKETLLRADADGDYCGS